LHRLAPERVASRAERDHAWIDDEDRDRRALRYLWLWVFGITFYFAWEAAAYRGLFAIVSEWEFDRLGQDLPTFNFTMLTMLLGWPALLLLGRFRDRQLRAEEESNEAAAPAIALDEEAIAKAYETQLRRHQHRLAMLVARDYMHFLTAFMSALWVAAFAVLVWAISLPDSTDNPRHYTPDSLSRQHPTEGAARFDGAMRYGRISSFGRGILLARRTSLYAPLVPPSGSDGRVRYFIEFLPSERPDVHSGGIIHHRDGVLVRSDLPGALIRLYRYLGYRPVADYYVLYASPITLRWPYLIVCWQFLFAGSLFALTALWQRLHLRRLTREVARREALATRPPDLPEKKPRRRVWWED
jgi:hypothetical protein